MHQAPGEIYDWNGGEYFPWSGDQVMLPGHGRRLGAAGVGYQDPVLQVFLFPQSDLMNSTAGCTQYWVALDTPLFHNKWESFLIAAR